VIRGWDHPKRLRQRLKGQTKARLRQPELEALSDTPADGARALVQDGGDVLRAMTEPRDRKGREETAIPREDPGPAPRSSGRPSKSQASSGALRGSALCSTFCRPRRRCRRKRMT